MNPLLSGKVVVIIGGTTGIGFAAAGACVEAGARIVCVGADPGSAEKAQRALGDAARVFSADARDPATAPRAIDEAMRSFGRFDAMYHVAGGSGRRFGDGPLHELPRAA